MKPSTLSTTLFHVNKWRQQYVDSTILAVEERFSKYDFMILDIKIEVDDLEKFLQIWQAEHIASKRAYPNPSNPNPNTAPLFRSLDIVDIKPNSRKTYTCKYLDLHLEFPKLYQQMRDMLPFDELYYVKIWQSIIPIGSHRDDDVKYLNFPSELRSLLYNENTGDVFYVHPELQPQAKRFVHLPPEANTFAFNNVRCLHGSSKPDPTKEKLLAIYTGKINWPKMVKLLEHSLVKYPNLHALTQDDDFGKYLKCKP